MDNRAVREASRRQIAGTILGIAMLLTGIFLLILRIQSYDFTKDGAVIVTDNFLPFLSRMVLVIGGLNIILKHKRGNYYAVGTYALSLGISRILRSLPYMGAPSDIMFYINIIFLMVGINLAIAGYNHLTVRTRDPVLMRYTTLSVVFAYVLLHLYFLYICVDPTVIYEYAGDTMYYLPLYIALLIVLFSKALIINTPMGRIRGLSAITAERLSMGDVVSVSKEDGSKLIEGFSDPQWKESTVGGIRLKEENITFFTKHGDRDVVLDRWEGDSQLYISVVDDGRDSFVTGHRIRAASYIEEDGRIDLLDDKGVCASIRIREEIV